MKAVFADTFYWVALLNPRDGHHSEAVALAAELADTQLITTDEVLLELLSFFSGAGPEARRAASALVRELLADAVVKVVPQSRSSFLAGLQLFEERADKGYSGVDAISMVTMREAGIAAVLTHDEHFAQEGFTPLFPRR